MEEFKKKLINRQILLFVAMLGAAGTFILSSRFEQKATMSEHLREFIGGFQAGIAAGLLCVLIVFAIRYFMAAGNPERLKKLYISETDERTLFIKQKTGDIGMNIISYGLIVGANVAGNLNSTVFITLMCALLFVSLVRGFLKIYYRRKY